MFKVNTQDLKSQVILFIYSFIYTVLFSVLTYNIYFVGVIEYDEVLTSLAEMTSQTSQEKTTETQKEVSKGANGETGVAGNLQALKKTQGVRREGFLTSREKSKVHDKDKEKPSERENECVQAQQTKASRRTTSLLNLFMSNSQGRFSSDPLLMKFLVINVNIFELSINNIDKIVINFKISNIHF